MKKIWGPLGQVFGDIGWNDAFPCGISDHHNVLVTVLKNTFGKEKSNISYDRDRGKFDNAVFRTELREALIRVEKHEYKLKLFRNTWVDSFSQ